MFGFILFSYFVCFVSAVPLMSDSETLVSSMNVQEVSNIFMSPQIPVNLKDLAIAGPTINKSDAVTSVHSSHVIEAAKDSAITAFFIPFEASKESSAVAAKISAAAALKGTVKGSAIATPIILKAVALPGIAAGATAGVMSIPKWLSQNVQKFPVALFDNMKSSVEDSAHNIANFLILEDISNAENFSSEPITEEIPQTLDNLKAGALGLATKGLAAAKNGVHTIGRIVLKPIKVLTGVHLKMLGSGLVLTGKLIGGTGTGIAKVGTGVKYIGLGHIGLGASAIGWGLDRTTIGKHFEESNKQFRLQFKN